MRLAELRGEVDEDEVALEKQKERERGCGGRETRIELNLPPVLNPKIYGGARVLEASGRPMLLIGRSFKKKSYETTFKIRQKETNRVEETLQFLHSLPF